MTGPSIGDSQQRNSQSDIAGSTNHLFGEKIRIVVRSAAGLVMKIVKLSDRSDTAESHLQKSHARRVVDVLRREFVGGAVHHLAPGPKTIFDVASAVFSATPDDALESVRVSVY